MCSYKRRLNPSFCYRDPTNDLNKKEPNFFINNTF